MKAIGIDAAIDEIESALFDMGEPGCQDTDQGDLVINTVGRLRLTRILKRLRVGYIRHTPVDSLCPQDLRVQARLKKAKRRK